MSVIPTWLSDFFLHGGDTDYTKNRDASQALAYAPGSLSSAPNDAYLASHSGPTPAPAPQGDVLGSSGSAPAGPDPLVAARAQVSPLLGQLNDLYNQINGQIGAYAQDQRNQVDNQYGNLFSQNDNSYKTGVDSINGLFSSNGASDSSYRGNALDTAKTSYNTAQTGLTNQRDQAYGQIGSAIAADKASLGDNTPIDLSQYTDVGSLQTLANALNSHISNLKSAQANLMTGGQLRDQLNQVAPLSSGLSATLKSQIDKLSQSGASPDAIMGLGSGYIARSGLPDDQKNQLTQYLMSILTPTQATTAAA